MLSIQLFCKVSEGHYVGMLLEYLCDSEQRHPLTTSCRDLTVEDNKNLLSQFYIVLHRENEDVSEWSCHIEDLLNKVIQNGEIPPTNTDQML